METLKLRGYWVQDSDDTLVPPWDFKDSTWETKSKKVVKDSSAAAIVVEQLARLPVKSELGHVDREMVDLYLGPMVDRLLKSLVLPGPAVRDIQLAHCFVDVSSIQNPMRRTVSWSGEQRICYLRCTI